MLSRIAESLYWVGRYVERAEDTARILDVHVHRSLEDPSVEEDAACRALLAVMGVAPPAEPVEPVDTPAMLALLGFDTASPTSIAGALVAARENARSARDSISSEMWECLNATYNALPEVIARVVGGSPHAFFSYVKERAAILAGLADSTMSRDDGWRFLVLGRSLERVDMTARLLSASFSETSGPAEWVTTLRCCSAHEAFLRTYRRRIEPDLVAEFLLLDRLFPRSCFHALGQAEECLAELQPGASRAGFEDEARRVLGRARTELEFRRVHELIADLPSHLLALQAACAQAGEAVAGRFFRQGTPLEWSLS
ncbi:MAG TPA: alpha-E domain-containing protein [Acidimicrobiales bacterium]|nr:alpha-E domain-containing protein [Acidimicrobiales bacterium]